MAHSVGLAMQTGESSLLASSRMISRILPHRQQDRHELMTCTGQMVFNMWRLLMEVSPLDEPVGFKIPQVLCEYFLRKAGHVPQELGTAH